MKPSTRLATFIRAVTLATPLALFAFAAPGADRSPENLFRQLQDYRTSNHAADELLKLARSDPKARKYLADHLPALLQNESPILFWVWANGAKLAGTLRITEASQPLADHVDRFSSPLSSMGWDNRGAVRALIEIGEPAVPSVAKVLRDGNVDQRKYSAAVLGVIGTPQCKYILRAALQRESDLAVLSFIKDALNPPMDWPKRSWYLSHEDKSQP